MPSRNTGDSMYLRDPPASTVARACRCDHPIAPDDDDLTCWLCGHPVVTEPDAPPEYVDGWLELYGAVERGRLRIREAAIAAGVDVSDRVAYAAWLEYNGEWVAPGIRAAAA